MPRPWRKEYAGAIYHVTCRGNGRERIVFGEDDAQRFREQLGEAVARDGVRLYAWALMPNHYHLLVETPHPNLAGFMQRLNTAYGMYFRHKHARPGHCFQGRYGAKLVKGDDYLLRLTRYIHLNPAKIGALQRETAEEKWKILKAYRWSSLAGYLDRHRAEADVDYWCLELMQRRGSEACRRAYAVYLRACLVKTDPVLVEAYGQSTYAIGDETHVREVEDEIRTPKRAGSQASDVLVPRKKPVTAIMVLATAAATCGITLDILRGQGRRAGLAKAMAIELACRTTGVSQREIAAALGTSEHAVGKQRQRLAERARGNSEIYYKYNMLSGNVLNI